MTDLNVRTGNIINTVLRLDYVKKVQRGILRKNFYRKNGSGSATFTLSASAVKAVKVYDEMMGIPVREHLFIFPLKGGSL